MGVSVSLEKVNYEKFIETLMKKFEKINDRELLEKVILQFGNHIGDDLVLLKNEFYEEGICTWNMTTMIMEIFNFSSEEQDVDKVYDTYLELKKDLISYKEIDDAYENLGIERKYQGEEVDE